MALWLELHRLENLGGGGDGRLKSLAAAGAQPAIWIESTTCRIRTASAAASGFPRDPPTSQSTSGRSPARSGSGCRDSRRHRATWAGNAEQQAAEDDGADRHGHE